MLDAETTAAGGGPVVNVAPLGGRARRIDLQGRMTAGWAGRLASGLAAQRIGIVRGWARWSPEGQWEAQLQVELPQYTLELTPAAVLQLAELDAGPSRWVLDGLELLSSRLAPIDGDLVVEVEAADAHGFLDRILRLFALRGLFPREMSVETADGMVHDVFRLRGADGATPDTQAVTALEEQLQRVTLG